MGITGLDFQFRFQRLRKREERRAKDRTPLLFWFWEEGLPEDVAFYCTLWSLELGKSSFSSATMHLRKKKTKPGFSGKEEGKVDIGRHWPQRVCVYRGKSRQPESRGCQQDILIRFRQNNLSSVSVLGLFNTHTHTKY